MAYRAPEGRGYADVAAHFREQIKDGELAPGDSLPSVSEIRQQFGVAGKTVSRALAVLKGEGLVVSRGALGTVVAKTPLVTTGANRLDRLNKSGRQYAPGETSTGHQVIQRSITDPEICAALEMEPHDEAVIRIRVFRQDGEPTSVGFSIYPPHTVAVVPELAEEGQMTTQFDKLYEQRTGRAVSRGRMRYRSRHATRDEMIALEIDTSFQSAVPVLYTTVTYHDEERPLTYWEDVYAPGLGAEESD
ncbi:GntR family transcriptional regulator [Streptomyces sp. NPDC058667]|uniref:GntR family transcriptional regulator n=1 Tax=Streptomyces sp. NPDC058667 TaxID=3346588 RepID=UPI00364A1E76